VLRVQRPRRRRRVPRSVSRLRWPRPQHRRAAGVKRSAFGYLPPNVGPVDERVVCYRWPQFLRLSGPTGSTAPGVDGDTPDDSAEATARPSWGQPPKGPSQGHEENASKENRSGPPAGHPDGWTRRPTTGRRVNGVREPDVARTTVGASPTKAHTGTPVRTRLTCLPCRKGRTGRGKRLPSGSNPRLQGLPRARLRAVRPFVPSPNLTREPLKSADTRREGMPAAARQRGADPGGGRP